MSFAAASAGTFTTSAGQTYEGEISRILADQVTLEVGAEKVEVALADFDAKTQSAIKAWAAANPQEVDVYTKWDEQPKIKSSSMPVMPEQFRDPSFTGMVSVDLILDEKGQVIHAAVKRSTHAELDQPSIDAAKTWLFEPAVIDGKPVKSKLRVPFRFVYTPVVAPPESSAL